MSEVQDKIKADAELDLDGAAETLGNQAGKDAACHPMLSDIFSPPDEPHYCIRMIRPHYIEYATMGSTEPETWQACGGGSGF